MFFVVVFMKSLKMPAIIINENERDGMLVYMIFVSTIQTENRFTKLKKKNPYQTCIHFEIRSVVDQLNDDFVVCSFFRDNASMIFLFFGTQCQIDCVKFQFWM